MDDRERVKRICALNDTLRQTGKGGQVLITQGVNELGHGVVARVVGEVARFDDFKIDNDPYGEHDCAMLKVDGLSIIWKIDYYDLTMKRHSPDPTDPAVTIRVMTIMLGSEY